MIERIRELAAEMKPAMIDLAQRLIRTPSLSGQEKDVADLILAELEKLGYDEVFRDPWGSVCGIIHGTEPGPAIMYNGHMDHVDIGDPSEWHGYDPYGGVIDIDEMYNEAGDALEKTEVIHGRAAADTKSGIACQIYSGAILAQLKKEGIGFKGDYMVSFVVMEEPAEQIGIIWPDRQRVPEARSARRRCRLLRGHRAQDLLRPPRPRRDQRRGRRRDQPRRIPLARHQCRQQSHEAHRRRRGLLCRALSGRRETRQVQHRADRHQLQPPGTMCIVPDRCNITYDRRLVPTETPEDAIAEIQAIIDRLSAEDPDFHATVKVSAVPRTTYTGITETKPNIKEGWRIAEDHPFVAAASNGLRSIGEPVSYGYWDFGTDLAMVSGRHHIASIGYSPMQEYYCHRPVDKCRIDFMERALVGNIAIFQELTKLSGDDFKI